MLLGRSDNSIKNFYNCNFSRYRTNFTNKLYKYLGLCQRLADKQYDESSDRDEYNDLVHRLLDFFI